MPYLWFCPVTTLGEDYLLTQHPLRRHSDVQALGNHRDLKQRHHDGGEGAVIKSTVMQRLTQCLLGHFLVQTKKKHNMYV